MWRDLAYLADLYGWLFWIIAAHFALELGAKVIADILALGLRGLGA